MDRSSSSHYNPNTHNAPNAADPQIMEKLKAAAMAQATNQSLGIYKQNDGDSQYGNFLVPTLPHY